MTEDRYAVTFRFEGGAERIVTVDGGRPLLHQALEQGLPLIHQCRSGSCGTCEATVVDGVVDMPTTTAIALTRREVAEGARLTCSSYARGVATLALPYSIELLDGPTAREWAGVIEEAVYLSASVVRLQITVLDSGFHFRSGQYARIRVPGTTEWRSYSMATTEADVPRTDFLVRLVEGGVMSEYLRSGWRRGDSVDMESPLGSFYVREGGQRVVLLAGGTGLAPIISMLDAIRSTRRPAPRVKLFFGCETEDDLFYLDELELREFWMPSLRVAISCARPSTSWNGPVGNPLSLLTESDLADPETVVYACGSPAMVDAVQEAFANRFPTVPLHCEQFRPSSV